MAYEDALIEKAVSFLYKTIEIEDIFVFGSFVEGNFNEESDIDIAVFVKNWGKYTLKDFARQLFYIQNYISSRIELHFFPSKTEPLTFQEYIRNTGRKVA